tara:strand:- start:14361 stop:14804 length:444 start_codon:yes stop_codon:yes gene_type:complete
MKKIGLFVIIFYFLICTQIVKANSITPLKVYLENKDIKDGTTQIFLLKRCSAVYAYASAIIKKKDLINSENFIEIANNLLLKAVELMIVNEKIKLEDASKKAEIERKKLFQSYIIDGKKNWEKNGSHFKGSYISEDMLICSKLGEEK